jgi:uncharacterized protein (DUF697 family)
MTRELKIRVAVTIFGWILAAIIQAGAFMLSYGRLAQKVDDLDSTVKALVQQQLAKQR